MKRATHLEQQQGTAETVDLTPFSAHSWKESTTPVLIINPAAGLHHRAALAHAMATDTLLLLEAGECGFGIDPASARAVMIAAAERTRQLVRLLEDVGSRTSVLEGGAA